MYLDWTGWYLSTNFGPIFVRIPKAPTNWLTIPGFLYTDSIWITTKKRYIRILYTEVPSLPNQKKEAWKKKLAPDKISWKLLDSAWNSKQPSFCMAVSTAWFHIIT